ncbi:hypothetical protein [uncultured Anaerococcus sp.]|uniref:hypothetical protein n=1 Tax=uncultured Anaerococcus sp. TaxID=293428 RepID=UPI00288BD02D|nr:hypothetical protein [uncultured Anaerococcus sp.]
MKLAAVNSVITILILFVPLILQILICKYIKGRASLILPGLSFIISIIYILNIPEGVGNWWIAVLTTLTLANIPTIIYYLIYRYYDKKEKQKDELDKMKIMDM